VPPNGRAAPTRARRAKSAAPVTTATVAKPPRPLSFEQVVAEVRSGIVKIQVGECNGTAIGTGFLVSNRLVATVEHVVDGVTSITLKQNGKTVGFGTVVGSDTARNLALVRSDRPISGHRFALAGRTPALGEDVSAIGSALDLPLTITRGSVSGTDRTIPINGLNRRGLVQTDAAVNPGNSGGPLITDSGTVVGLVDLGTNQTNGLAFAVTAAEVNKGTYYAERCPENAPTANTTNGPTRRDVPRGWLDGERSDVKPSLLRLSAKEDHQCLS
jgi:serine protease Do